MKLYSSEVALQPGTRTRLGTLLVDNGVLSGGDLAAALIRQSERPGTRLGVILRDMGT
jgi:hypothetical protein